MVAQTRPPSFNGDDNEGCTGTCKLLFNLPPSNQSVLQWNSGHDESVEVNQRALIDKVLARYSGEFTGAFPAVLTIADNMNINV